ncbi:MAG: hypothetical protein HZB46_06255 [Solirubrobacterales bacterium]|nr:hypothetical protein [Solirubrobacterales bacterium]
MAGRHIAAAFAVAVALGAAAPGAGADGSPAVVAEQLDGTGDAVRMSIPVEGRPDVALRVAGEVSRVHAVAAERDVALAPATGAPPGGWRRFAAPDAGAGPWTVVADVVFPRGPGGLPDPARLPWAVQDCGGDAGCVPVAEGAVALRDVRGAGATVLAHAGDEVAVPFALRVVGDGTWALAAAGDLPGAVVSGAGPPLAGDGIHDVLVRVAVPADAAPGAYAVVVTATRGGVQRRAVAELRVLAAPQAQEELLEVLGVAIRWTVRRLDFVGQDVVRVRAGGVADLGDVLCFKALTPCGDVRVRLVAGGRVLGRARLVLAPKSRTRALVHLGARTRAWLRAGAAIPATALVRPGPLAPALAHQVTLRAS